MHVFVTTIPEVELIDAVGSDVGHCVFQLTLVMISLSDEMTQHRSGS